MKTLHRFSDALIRCYGQSLQRIPINLYLSCPHRINGKGGCSFCPEDGIRARHMQHEDILLEEQVAHGIDYVQKRYQAKPPYIAYFQSYTNTYGDIARLKGLYERALNCAPFRVVMIATRPDCLSEDVLNYLEELNQRYDVWVELGVQTANDVTLQRVNRGHDFACSVDAIHALHARKIKVAIHLILGLPGETREIMLDTIRALAPLPVQGVKFHQLFVLKNTPMAHEFHQSSFDFHIQNEYDYAEVLANCIDLLPEDWILMRLCADPPETTPVMPHWWMKKGQFIDYFTHYFTHRESALWVQTEDGSLTAYNPQFRQHFHTTAGAMTETNQRFIVPSQLYERIHEKNVRILDIGFGLGYNAFAAWEIIKNATHFQHHIDTLEFDPHTRVLAQKIQGSNMSDFFANDVVKTPHASLQIHWGDARKFVINTPKNYYDIIFLDAFSPDVNPELWTYDFIRRLSSALTDDGCILTYSTAFPVLGTFLRCGFHLYHTAMIGHKKPGIIALKHHSENQKMPLREKDIRIARNTLAGVCYRDPHFSADKNQITLRRKALVERLKKRGVPKWLNS